MDSTNPKTMYVAMRDGLFKSTDGGQSWKSLGKEFKNMAAVTVNPKKPDEIYAATTDGKIFASADGGVKWKSQR
jgi:photosystem II stability/assembly factor-like uncharacterized protein